MAGWGLSAQSARGVARLRSARPHGERRLHRELGLPSTALFDWHGWGGRGTSRRRGERPTGSDLFLAVTSVSAPPPHPLHSPPRTPPYPDDTIDGIGSFPDRPFPPPPAPYNLVVPPRYPLDASTCRSSNPPPVRMSAFVVGTGAVALRGAPARSSVAIRPRLLRAAAPSRGAVQTCMVKPVSGTAGGDDYLNKLEDADPVTTTGTGNLYSTPVSPVVSAPVGTGVVNKVSGTPGGDDYLNKLEDANPVTATDTSNLYTAPEPPVVAASVGTGVGGGGAPPSVGGGGGGGGSDEPDVPSFDAEASRVEMKGKLLEVAAATDRGQLATSAQKEAVEDLVSMLEAANPTDSPVDTALIDGTWLLVYASKPLFKTTPLLLAAATPLLVVGQVKQTLRVDSGELVNDVDVTAFPLISATVSTTARVTPVTGERLELVVEKTGVKGKNIAGKLDLGGIGGSLPVEQLYGKLKNGAVPETFLDTFYLDEKMRISRGKGGAIYVFSKM